MWIIVNAADRRQGLPISLVPVLVLVLVLVLALVLATLTPPRVRSDSPARPQPPCTPSAPPARPHPSLRSAFSQVEFSRNVPE